MFILLKPVKTLKVENQFALGEHEVIVWNPAFFTAL